MCADKTDKMMRGGRGGEVAGCGVSGCKCVPSYYNTP